MQRRHASGLFVSAITLALGATHVVAAPVAPGDLVVYRVGDGSGTLSATNATAAFLDEYTTAGALVQSITVPASGGSASTSLGTSTTEGVLTPSQNGASIVFSGYRHDAGTAPTSADARVIGTLNAAGVVDTSNAVTDTAAAVPRSATTDNGSTYYLGMSTGVRYVGTPGPAATSSLLDNRNSRQVFLANNNLYASNGSTTTTAKVQSYGNLPTGTTTPTAVVTLGTADAVNGIYFLDLDAGVAGVDTLYILSTVQSQLQKYTFNGTAWNASGFISSSAANLTAVASGSNVNLYLTTPTSILALTDSSGFGGTLAGTPASIVTAGTNTAFRGIATFPVPEPTSLAVLAAAGLLVLRPRRSC